MSIPAEQMDAFFKSGGTDESVVTKMREVIPEPAPEPVEQPVEAPKVETKVEAPKVEEKPIPEAKFVPLEALQEERAEKKQLKAELEQFKQWQAGVQEQLKRIPAAEQAQAPDPQTDPFGYQNWALQQLGGTVQEINQWRAQQQQQAQVQAQTQQVLGWASQKAKEFEASQPEYPNAYKFATEARDKEYQALGFTDPLMRSQLIERDTAGIIQHAAQNGLNPAELIFNFAKIRGFAPKGTTAQTALDPNALEKISKGQAAAPKLDKGGSTADGEMSAKDLANINDPAEFEKQWKKIFGKK